MHWRAFAEASPYAEVGLIIMICSDRQMTREMIAALGRDEESTAAREWRGIGRDARIRARASVLGVIQLENAVAEVRTMRQEGLAVPLVVVLPRLSGSLMGLNGVRVDAIVWRDRIAHDLAAAVRAAAARSSVTERLAEIIEDHPGHVDPVVRRGLVRILRSGPPLPSRTALGRMIASDGSRAAQKVAGLFGARPRFAVRWKRVARMLMAYDLASPNGAACNARHVAKRLGIDRKTLRDSIQRVTGASLGELRTMPPEEVLWAALEELSIGTSSESGKG